MKILSIITSFTAGGAEVLVSNLSGEFVAAGHGSTVVALVDAETIGNSPTTQAEQIGKIERAGGNTRVLPLGKRRGFIPGARALRQVCRELQPDLIHVHTARAVPMLWLARAEAPVVLTHHNSKLSFRAAMFLLFDRVVDRYVAISRRCEELLSAHTRRTIVPIVNATGHGFLVNEGRQAPSSRVELLAVGALTDQKNYAMLIEAAALARSAHPDRPFRLRIAGNGGLRKDLQNRIGALGLTDHVELLGDRSDVPDLLRQAHIFVNASHYEGLSIATLEALQSALPVVATRVEGNVELVAHGGNGLLCEPDDAAAFAEGIAKVLEDARLYEKMSQGALEVGKRYQLDNCARAHLQLYRELAAGRQPIRKGWPEMSKQG